MVPEALLLESDPPLILSPIPAFWDNYKQTIWRLNPIVLKQSLYLQLCLMIVAEQKLHTSLLKSTQYSPSQKNTNQSRLLVWCESHKARKFQPTQQKVPAKNIDLRSKPWLENILYIYLPFSSPYGRDWTEKATKWKG